MTQETSSSSGPGRNSGADGNCRDPGHDYLRGLSHSLHLRGSDLDTHHFAREPKGHAAIIWSRLTLRWSWRSVCLDFSELCYQRSDPAFPLGDQFVFSCFLCSQRNHNLRRGFNIRTSDRCWHSDMGAACLSGNERGRYTLAHVVGIDGSGGYCGNRAGGCSRSLLADFS